MAPVKPIGVDQKTRVDSNPKTRPGVTGFVQEYNQEGPKYSDLNPDVVTDDSVLPNSHRATAPEKARRGRRSKK